MKKALVVGAGFAGAVAARELAEAGWSVKVIDKREHIAGNAFDYVNEHGIRVHKYGPHLWHTSNDEVQAWASRFTEWLPYGHHVKAALDTPTGEQLFVPLPINPETIEEVFRYVFVSWCKANNQWDYSMAVPGPMLGSHAKFLETLVEHHDPVTNSRQHVENSVGKELCDLFFAPYTKKMWGLALEELPASVAARIPTNVESGSDLYFPKDKYQCLPKDGYTAMFERIFDHENIEVELGCSRKDLAYWEPQRKFDVTFTAEPIDEYFDCQLGPLPWRSIKMHVSSVPLPQALPAPVVNFTHDGPHTRVTEWKQLPGHGDNPWYTTLTFEQPCDYVDNHMERYYPVKTSQADCPNRALYNRYADLAEQNPSVIFIGRCGRYVYTDMAPCISSSLAQVRRFLRGEPQE